jgi:hypothetical protein
MYRLSTGGSTMPWQDLNAKFDTGPRRFVGNPAYGPTIDNMMQHYSRIFAGHVARSSPPLTLVQLRKIKRHLDSSGNAYKKTIILNNFCLNLIECSLELLAKARIKAAFDIAWTCWYYFLYFITKLFRLRINELQEIKMDDIALGDNRGIPYYRLKLPFRKTDQRGAGTSFQIYDEDENDAYTSLKEYIQIRYLY